MNETVPAYEWKNYKKLIIRSVRRMLSVYPKMSTFKLRPEHMQLRYVDVFDKKLLSAINISNFLATATNLKVELPEFLNDAKQFGGANHCRINYEFPVKGMKESYFSFELGTGKRAGTEDVVRLEHSTRLFS